jgi:hypothetical protein
MRSSLVVISWWSNCLGLVSIYNLVAHTRARDIYTVQVGKPEEQKASFRSLLPTTVQELPYPPGRGAEDWRVREVVARELLGDHAGLWFIDHDLFVQEDCESWLEDMDRRLRESNVCLCHPSPRRGPAITNPAFWLSPVRLPPDTPSFARLPYREEPVFSRPYALRQSRAAIMPTKDTLVAAMEFLQRRDMVCGFPLCDEDRVTGGPRSFPRFVHVGGLYTFTGEVSPESQHDWTARCVERFTAFYEACPPEWVSVEDPVLLQRLEEFQRAVWGRDGAFLEDPKRR